MSDDIRATIGGRYDLPANLSARLVGETPDELERDARQLAQAIAAHVGPEFLSGGLDPSGESGDDFDPVKTFRDARRPRYF